MKSFGKYQFGYCLLIWMFYSKHITMKIKNYLQERAIRITDQDYKTTFQELLNRDNSVLIH